MCCSYTAHVEKGILFIQNIDHTIQFNSLIKILRTFGRINKIFFTKINIKKKKKRCSFSKIIGWIEYFDKIEAKKTSKFFRNMGKIFLDRIQVLKFSYLKGYEWKYVVNFKKNEI